MPSKIALHAPHTDVVDAAEVVDWLDARVDAAVELHEPFLDWLLAQGDVDAEDLAAVFASARVLEPYDPATGNDMLGVRRYEERALEEPERAGGVLYDGYAVQRGLFERLPAGESGGGAGGADDEDVLHIALLDRALATWGDHDGRWHKRYAVLGRPALVSVPGLYEAPAKPEEYYKEQQKAALTGGGAPPREVLEEEVEGDFLVEDDPRTTKALKGPVLAAWHYEVTGEAFCDEAGCRLHDAHRQPQLVADQLRGRGFCDRHGEIYDP